MLHRTIFIGLGSTGCNTIDALQDIAFLTTGNAEMGGAWAYLKLDTAMPTDTTFCGDTAHSVHIQVAAQEISTLTAHLRQLDNSGNGSSKDLTWLWKDGKLRIDAKIAGSGLNRRYARGCIYYYWNVETNPTKNLKTWLSTMKNQFIAAEAPRSPQKIEEKLRAILPAGSAIPQVSPQEVRIVIVLALGGGTGTGGLLELAKLIHGDNITSGDMLCLSYPPSVNHPQTGTPGGNDRRYNALECLQYYEQYAKDPNSPRNLRPHFIISPSKDGMDLAVNDDAAMRQLEYLGAMFLTRITAALDFDKVMVDLNSQFPQPYPWSIAMAGVRIPALEIKAAEIYKAVGKICDQTNSSDPISWYKNAQVAAETVDKEAWKILKVCFDHISQYCHTKFSPQNPPRKADFYTEYTNNKANWFDDQVNHLVEEMLPLAIEEIKRFMHANSQARSIRYVEELVQRMQSKLAKIPVLNDAKIQEAYNLLRGDPPHPQGRTKLFVWYLREAVAQTVQLISEKLEIFKSILEGVTINKDAIELIKQRQDTNFYANIEPNNFRIEIPSFSFLELEPVLNLFRRPNERLNATELKTELMRVLSRDARLPSNTTFDRTQFSKAETKAFLSNKIDHPLLNLEHFKNLIPIYNVCFGGALTDLIDSSRENQREQFEQSIADLNLQVATSRIDPVLTRIMSPLQLDALKIWAQCRYDDLTISTPQYGDGIQSSNHPDMFGDYYLPLPPSNVIIDAFKNLLVCSTTKRPDADHLHFIDVLFAYQPTSFGAGGAYGLNLKHNITQDLLLRLPESGDINEVVKALDQLCSTDAGKEHLLKWNRLIDTKKRTDPTLKNRMQELFAQGEIRITLPDGRVTTIYEGQLV